MTDTQRLQAYQTLTQQLLDCPRGEELKLLEANRELIDPQFIAVTEEKAIELEEAGNTEQAQFLQAFAAQLKQAFAEVAQVVNREGVESRAQAYLMLIDGMLQCSTGEDVAQLLSANPDLVDAGLVQMIAKVAQAMAAKGQNKSASFLLQVATDLAQIINSGS
ncbi:MAG: hypothetical protein SAL07_24720 [Oscillatoria sp. PMC 1051.18]|uniref:hypothetical protein n=1 Tax=Oscillatoria salina TaxID=331517 RepID=UPI0013BB7389|nr:hypothetical protein [Oscillatoria salina]MBZ8182018.1 hypothetical protein [Oscillatoria salina IIICB1]MEC4896219.1 hypothetical protein [Oscillatoria sp. PMC 1050.18]MEC5033113.1 hypothetical protein [Oscillatoria sp. PMC 1051.18]NET87347.1 hypothetical protein [Kamptonema sp. SIO1D9]